jgi:hypothetical protein
MNFVRLLPVFLSFLLIAAHFQRAGFSVLALLCLLAPCLLYFTRPWSIRVLQILMILSALEWIRTLMSLVQLRQEADLPWIRLAVILGSVALFTAASTFIFRCQSVRRKYYGMRVSPVNNTISEHQ